jgi:hypothetical protein
MEVPQGFEYWFAVYVVLLLLETLYGLKQVAMTFWRELLKAFRSMGFDRSEVDPHLYFKWTQHGLLIWVSWTDACLVIMIQVIVLKCIINRSCRSARWGSWFEPQTRLK